MASLLLAVIQLYAAYNWIRSEAIVKMKGCVWPLGITLWTPRGPQTPVWDPLHYRVNSHLYQLAACRIIKVSSSFMIIKAEEIYSGSCPEKHSELLKSISIKHWIFIVGTRWAKCPGVMGWCRAPFAIALIALAQGWPGEVFYGTRKLSTSNAGGPINPVFQKI